MSSERPRPRQEPVSCESCRRKKLKCNREHPCGNCLSRDVPCTFNGKRVPVSATASIQNNDETSALRAENAKIQARLDKIEDLLLNGSIEEGERPSKYRRIVNRDRTSSLPSPATTLSASSDPERAKSYRSETQWLEGIGTQENTRLPQLSVDFNIRVVPFEQVVQQSGVNSRQDRCIWLPLETQAMQLFECYTNQLDPLQHVIHAPSARRAINLLYERLHLGQKLESSQTLLLLSILTSIATYWGLSEDVSTVFGSTCFEDFASSSTQTALKVSMQWLRTSLDILEHVRRSSSMTLETVQASIIIIFLVYHIEGFSPKVRSMLYAALAAAKDLGLHRTDAQPPAGQQETQADVVEQEIRRRVFWHIASTDWSLALAGGPHEGTYNVQPKHIRCKKPRNVSDEELETMPADFEHPRSEPTIMAYYLHRIRLAEVCRRITDLNWETDIDDITVDDIHAIDREFITLLSDLPPFLRLDRDNRKLFQHLDATPHMVIQRYIVNLTIQARRGKFHLPFILRASHDPSFAFSRDACLGAARAVMQLRQDLSDEDGTLWIANSRLCGMIHLFFFATVVLVMDMSVNRTLIDEHTRKGEIQRACKTLEESKRQSAAAGMFFDSLMSILRKHRIRLPGYEYIVDLEDGSNGPVAATGDALAPGSSTNGSQDPINYDQGFDFDELWRSYMDLEPTVHVQDWEHLIGDF